MSTTTSSPETAEAEGAYVRLQQLRSEKDAATQRVANAEEELRVINAKIRALQNVCPHRNTQDKVLRTQHDEYVGTDVFCIDCGALVDSD